MIRPLVMVRNTSIKLHQRCSTTRTSVQEQLQGFGGFLGLDQLGESMMMVYRPTKIKATRPTSSTTNDSVVRLALASRYRSFRAGTSKQIGSLFSEAAICWSNERPEQRLSLLSHQDTAACCLHFPCIAVLLYSIISIWHSATSKTHHRRARSHFRCATRQ